MIPTTAVLAAEYTVGPHRALNARDARCGQDDADRRGFMTRAACLMPRNTDRSSTAIVKSYSSTGISSIGPRAPRMPALLNIPSSVPNCSTAPSTVDAISSSFVTSQ